MPSTCTFGEKKKKRIHAESSMRKIILVQYRNRNSTLSIYANIDDVFQPLSLFLSPNRY